jgi:hypothetical protein
MSAQPSERRLRGQIAANSRWATVADRTAATAPARAAFLDRFERQVDPDGLLPPDERARRAESARKAHFGRLALASARARRKVSEAQSELERAEAAVAECDQSVAAR